MNSEEILQSYIDGRQNGEDNKLRAAVGKLAADRSKELTDAIRLLHQQVPITISELRATIRQSADAMIASNERLSRSNEAYSKWIKWLTVGLVLVGVAQVIVAFITNAG